MSDFQRSLQFQGRNLQRQWQEKPLLRMAIWSLCLLLVVHLVMLSMDWREERGEEYRRLAGEWLKLQDVSRQTAWPERAMQAEQVLNLQRERFWQAPNASQARADVQAWLTERVRLADCFLAASRSKGRSRVSRPRFAGSWSQPRSVGCCRI
jgi:hypothetical protein